MVNILKKKISVHHITRPDLYATAGGKFLTPTKRNAYSLCGTVALHVGRRLEMVTCPKRRSPDRPQLARTGEPVKATWWLVSRIVPW